MGENKMEPFVERSSRGEGEAQVFDLMPFERENARLSAGFSGRGGGCSAGSYASLNIGLHVQDRAEDVLENRNRLMKTIGWRLSDWTSAEQVHGAEVAIAEHKHRGCGSMSQADAFAGCDGLITQATGVLLASFYADCVPLYFYDPVQQAIGLAHAGWKGTVSEIGAVVPALMEKAFGSRPADLLAAIGPSIGMKRYEVDGEAQKRCEQLVERLIYSQDQASGLLRYASNGKINISLKEMNRQIMIKAGILPQQIYVSGWCTAARTDKFFSHRDEGGRTGRMASWIGLREEVNN